MRSIKVVLAFLAAVVIGGTLGYISVRQSTKPSADELVEASANDTPTSQPRSLATFTATPDVSPTSTSIVTPDVTDTSSPTSTPRPTNTPRPTSTPRPTVTATTPPMESIILTGSGDSIVDLDKPDDPALVHITGNAASRHFAVISYGTDGEQIDLLVNTTDPYDGVRPLDFLNDEHTARFEVTSTGPWTIEVLSLFDIPKAAVPGIYEGTGDGVFFLDGAADTATITGNDAGHHFAVESYGNGYDLLVNTTEPYSGQVIVSRDARIFVVKAAGPWAIKFSAP